jgi:polygalacturonase
MRPVIALLFSLGLPLCAATFNVLDFGATGDGRTFDTAAIQKALDACQDSGGTVEFPPGTYLCQPLTLHGQTTVQVDAGALLQASTNHADFMKHPGDWLKARGTNFIPLIRGSELTNLTLTGGGVIDGGGAVWWDAAEQARQVRPGYTLPRPNLIALDRCKNVRIENLTLRNSPKFHLLPADCDDLVISNVTILAPEHAANTDAIDPSGHRILITHCILDVGDDNVAIKAPKKPAGQAFESEDITVTDCAFLHGHGMSIGSETAGGVHHVVVRNCAFRDTENGLRIKSDVRRGGLVQDITYQDITMSNVAPAITLTCLYQSDSSGDTNRATAAAPTDAGTVPGRHIPAYRDIHIVNLTDVSPKAAGTIIGLPENCVSNVVLENVRITAAKSFDIRNARGVQLKNVSVTVAKGEPFVLQNAEVSGLDGK